MKLDAGEAAVVIEPQHGGRVASLKVAGRHLLVTRDDKAAVGDPKLWGCYPMVPWAGRVRNGRFRFRGTDHRLPRHAPPHAIHGVGYLAAWEEVGSRALRLDMTGLWPFGGAVEQQFDLTANALSLRMTVTATDQAMPVVAGWHPCFRTVHRGERARVDVVATSMWERDPSGIPTGQLVGVPPGPWDDAFTGLRGDPRLTWPGQLEVTLRSACPTWVVYDEDPRVVCVEPQTDAPDAFNREPAVLEPGEQLAISLIIEWRTK